MNRLSKLPIGGEECNVLRKDNVVLKQDIDNLQHHCAGLSRQLKERDKELEESNKMKELVDLCKLCLTGSVVPVASCFAFYLLIGTSLPFE